MECDRRGRSSRNRLKQGEEHNLVVRRPGAGLGVGRDSKVRRCTDVTMAGGSETAPMGWMGFAGRVEGAAGTNR
jgi:hypothetical protein